MKDFFNQPLAVGDKVAIIRTGYRDFVHGEVVKLTAQKVRVEVRERGQYGETLRFPWEVVKRPIQ